MEQLDIQARFISLWKDLGPQWGISKTTAQVHALLLTSDIPLTMDDVIAHLGISRGNASMTLTELQAWTLITRTPGQRGKKDLFIAEKSAWKIAQAIAAVRRQRELDPLIQTLSRLQQNATQTPDTPQHLIDTITGILTVAKRSGKLLELACKVEQITFFKPIAALFKARSPER